MIKLTLPIPVSLNGLYNNSKKGGRTKTAKAKAWTRDAQHPAQACVKENLNLCNYNIDLRNRKYSFKQGTYLLKPLHEAHPGLSYHVEYAYAFKSNRHKNPCDIANFEKLLSDFLVDMGLMLDDSFIDDLHLKRIPPNPKQPHVQITIKTLDLVPYLY